MRIEFQKAEVRALREAHRRARLIAAQAARLRARADRVQQAALQELLGDYVGWIPEGAELVYGADRVPIGLQWEADKGEEVPPAESQTGTLNQVSPFVAREGGRAPANESG